MKTVRKLTLGDAAKRAGVSKATISKALSSQKLSGDKIPTKNGRYEFSIDPSELDRVFPHKQPDEHQSEQKSTHQRTPDKHQESNALAVEVKMLREALEVQKGIAERERELANDLRKQLDRALNLLAPPAPATAPTPSLWQRLFGKG